MSDAEFLNILFDAESAAVAEGMSKEDMIANYEGRIMCLKDALMDEKRETDPDLLSASHLWGVFPAHAGMYRQIQYEFRSQSEEGKPGLCDG